MSPEELAEARHYATCYQAGYVHDLMHNFLAHIDQQAARIKELDDAVSGPLENIAKMLETVNADTIFAGVIQTWKTENQTLRSQISDLEKRNADLEARLGHEQVVTMQDREAQLQGHIQELRSQVAALKKIAEEERAAVLTADICDGGDGYGHLSICGMNAISGTPTRVDDFYGREERVAMAYRQLAEEHPEAFR